jgi:hypothetical protein
MALLAVNSSPSWLIATATVVDLGGFFVRRNGRDPTGVLKVQRLAAIGVAGYSGVRLGETQELIAPICFLTSPAVNSLSQRCTAWTTVEPLPTLPATLLTEFARTSPTAKTPGTPVLSVRALLVDGDPTFARTTPNPACDLCTSASGDFLRPNSQKV